MCAGDSSSRGLSLEEGFDLAVRSQHLIAAWVVSRWGGPAVDNAVAALVTAYPLDQALAVLTCLVEVYARQQADREGLTGSSDVVARLGFDRICGTDPELAGAASDLVAAVGVGTARTYRILAEGAIARHGPAVLRTMGRLGAGLVRLTAEHQEQSPIEVLARPRA